MSKEALYIVYSDIHHNVWNQYNENDRRVKISLEVENHIFKVAKKLNVDVLFTGDIMHTEKHITNKLLSYILPHYKRLEKYGVNMYAISGNHDQCEINIKESRSPNYIKTFSRVFDYIKCLDFKVSLNKGTLICGIPYLTHDQGLLEHLKSIPFKTYSKAKVKICMMHTTLPTTRDTDGRLIQTNTIGHEVMNFLEKKFDLVLVGHIHKPMKLGKNIIQVGATNQQRKTDKECDLGYWIIYKDLSSEFVPVKSARFVELEWDEKKPDDDNFYYNKLKEIPQKEFKVQVEGNFDNTTNTRKLARSYLKEKEIKDSTKKKMLISILKDSEL